MTIISLCASRISGETIVDGIPRSDGWYHLTSWKELNTEEPVKRLAKNVDRESMSLEIMSEYSVSNFRMNVLMLPSLRST